MKSLGKQIRERREALGLAVNEVSRRAAMGTWFDGAGQGMPLNAGTLSRIENELVIPTLDSLTVLSLVLGCEFRIVNGGVSLHAPAPSRV